MPYYIIVVCHKVFPHVIKSITPGGLRTYSHRYSNPSINQARKSGFNYPCIAPALICYEAVLENAARCKLDISLVYKQCTVRAELGGFRRGRRAYRGLELRLHPEKCGQHSNQSRRLKMFRSSIRHPPIRCPLSILLHPQSLISITVSKATISHRGASGNSVIPWLHVITPNQMAKPSHMSSTW